MCKPLQPNILNCPPEQPVGITFPKEHRAESVRLHAVNKAAAQRQLLLITTLLAKRAI